jgi:periplasmic copper chaperone A
MTMNRFFLSGLALTAAVLMWSGASLAQDKSAFSFDHPWARASLTEKGNSAAYFVLTNKGGADRLIGAKSGVAKLTEVHEHVMKNNVMEMRKVEGGVAVPAGGTVKFEPAGLHVMLIGLTAKLEAGQSFPLTLTFEKAGDVKVDVKVEPPSNAASSGGHTHH